MIHIRCVGANKVLKVHARWQLLREEAIRRASSRVRVHRLDTLCSSIITTMSVALDLSYTLLTKTLRYNHFLAYRRCSTAKTPYQHKYPSYDHMVHSEKSLARKLLLIEDRTSRLRFLHSVDPEKMSQLLDTKVNSVEYYSTQGKKMTLVELENFDDFISKKNFHFSDGSLPIKSRMFQLVSIPPHMKGLEDKGFKPNVHIVTPKAQEKPPNLPSSFSDLESKSHVTELGSKLRFFFLVHLEELLCTGTFGQFHMLPFGSSVNGLGDDASDLDIVMAPQEVKLNSGNFLVHLSRPPYSEKYKEQCLTRIIGDQLQLFVPGILNSLKISGARVPIVKLRSSLTGLESDISFSTQCNGVAMSRATFQLTLLEPKFVNLYTFIKIWGRTRELIDSVGMGFSNFMMLCMLIGFMQLRKPCLLPPINSITPGMKKECNNSESHENLLREFFQFIHDFKWKENGISILNGQIIPNPLPKTAAMYIENPYETGHNICKNIRQDRVEDLVNCVRDSLKLMQTEKYSLFTVCQTLSNPQRRSKRPAPNKRLLHL